MENSVISVQIANGTFVPVLDTSSRKRRRLVVTTVRDNQENVKIELFRGSDESMADAEYVGSLVIDNIEPAEHGAPDVSVLLGVDESGNLNATATDTQSGEYQSLSVSLEQLDEEGGYDMPDFQLSDGELTLDDLSLDDEEFELDEEDLTADLSDDSDSDELEASDASQAESPSPTAAPSPSDALPETEDFLEAEESPDDELEELSLDTEESLDDLTLDDLSFDEEPVAEEDLSDELEGEASSQIDLPSQTDALPETETAPEAPPEYDTETPSDTETALDDELEELSLDDISLEDSPSAEDDFVADDLAETDELEEFSFDDLEPAAESPETPAESLEPTESPEPSAPEEPGQLDDFVDEEFSFDESFSAEGDLSEDDFDLGSLTQDLGEDVSEDLSDNESRPSEGLSMDSELDEGMVEADLGDEDFTFDEGVEDEPLFADAASGGELEDDDFLEEGAGLGEQLEDTLSPEEFDRLDSEPVPAGEPETGDTEAVVPRKSNAIIFVGYLILALSAVAVLTYLVFRLMEGPPAPPLRAGLRGALSFAVLFLGVPRLKRAPRG